MMLKNRLLDRCSEDDLLRAIMRKDRNKIFTNCFREAVHRIESDVTGISESPQEALEFYKSFRKIVSMDLSFSNIARFAYKGEREQLQFHIPNEYYDGDKLQKIPGNKRQVEVKSQYVIEIPYEPMKWCNCLRRKDSLDPEKYKGEELPCFYPELNMILQGGGCIHRTAEAFVNGRAGMGMVMQYDIAPLFKHMKTDGANWINIHTDKVIRPVGDYRLALIFWIRQQELGIGQD